MDPYIRLLKIAYVLRQSLHPASDDAGAVADADEDAGELVSTRMLVRMRNADAEPMGRMAIG